MYPSGKDFCPTWGVLMLERYRISQPISPGLICVCKAFWWAYQQGAYTRRKKMFNEKLIQNSQFAILNAEGNITIDNNLNNNYL